MDLPPNWQLTIVESNPSTPLVDLRLATEAALAQPLQSKRLRDLTRPGARVCLVFTDATRACPDQVLVPAMLRELESANVRDEDITLLCATGLHRASTREEKIAKLGPAVVDRYRVIDHDASVVTDLPAGQSRLESRPSNTVTDLPAGQSRLESRPSNTVTNLPAGQSRLESRLTVNPLLLQSDLIIATGVVEPHQYAGYSGSGKTVVIGCGGEATIGLTHGPKFLEQPGVRLGRVEDNPFQQFVREAARQIGLKFVVNVVLDGDEQAVAVQAGEPVAVHDELIGVARALYEVPVPQQYDIVIAKVDPPKDVNLYQASRAPTYIGLSAAPMIRPGGVMIIEARCPEGAGQGVGEQRFFAALSQATDLAQMLMNFRANGCRAGEQRAFMLAQVLLQYQVIFAGSECSDVVRACKMLSADSIDAAIEQVREKVGNKAAVLYLPHPLQTLRVLM